MQLNVLNHNTAERAAPAGFDPDAVRSLEADLRANIAGEVRFDAGSRGLYATDASNYRQLPIGVVVPRTIEDVVAAVAAARRHGAPVLSRGGGTSLAGQCCNVAVVIDFSKHINRILDIDVDRGIAHVQPGVLHDQLSDLTENKWHLTFAPDTSTHAWATIGGMIGNNACGPHSVMAGRTSDNILSMDILTYDGVRMTVGETSEEKLNAAIAAGGRAGEIYRGLREIRDRYGNLIRQRYPDIPRRVSGYNLDDLLPERGFNLARALVGSEGTCATILEATVQLVHNPPAKALVILGYPDIFTAGDHVPEILEHQPTALEGLDDKLVSFMRTKGLNVQYIDLLPEGDGFLLAEFGGEDEHEAAARARRFMAAMEKKPDAPTMRLAADRAEQTAVWEIRESGLGATAWVQGMQDTWPGWEDAAVDPAHLGDYMREFRELLNAYDYDCSLYGHFGQACVHCRISFDLYTKHGVDHYRSFIDDAADLVLKYNGSFSGEHGDGQSRGRLLQKMFGSELLDAFREFKGLWDPDGRMNPGKVTDADPPTANLRLGPDYQPWEPETHFTFPEDDHSFAHAALRCVGVGKCRRTENAFMCPSFLVTREEADTTRGRARLLFEMLNGEEFPRTWRNDEVRDALDLCLACKGCKKECPVNVDMATYKAEFLSHYYEGRLRPRDAYFMGLIGFWAELASIAPSLANVAASVPPLSNLAKFITGVAPERDLPAFAPETFRAWFRRRSPRNPDGPPVALLADVFNDHFFPDTLIATVEVLERLGYRVHLPDDGLPAVRPAIHYGMLKLAKRQVRRAIAQLRDFARDGVPIIGVEPSTVAVYRDELPNLFPHDQDAKRLTKNTHLLSEFLAEQDVDLPRLDRKAILHAHCHEKAVLDADAMRDVLKKMGIEIEEPEVGCCGMAGSFGFEAGHYDVAQAVGERNLFPAVHHADDHALIIIAGFSCREQISQATGREPMHFAEVLRLAFRHQEQTRQPGDVPRGDTTMHTRHHEAEPLKGLAAGLIGGLAGTVAMTAFQALASKGMQAMSSDGRQDDRVERSEDRDQQKDESATAKAMRRVSEGVFGHHPSQREAQMGGQAVHFGFGTIMGGLYGVTTEFWPDAARGAGLPFGTALMLGADEVAVPATGLSGPPTEIPLSTHAYALASHLVYGAVAEAVRCTAREMMD